DLHAGPSSRLFGLPKLVREGGVEPPRAFARWILNPVRLPVSPLSRSGVAAASHQHTRGCSRAEGSGVTEILPLEGVGGLGGKGGRRLGPALEVALMLDPETLQTPLTDPVGELDRPAAPGGHAAPARIAPIASVPRTSADQHGVLQARVVALSEERIEGAASRVPHETTC